MKGKESFKLCDVRVAQFRRGSTKVYIKFSHSQEDFIAFDHHQKKAQQSLLTHIRNKTNPLREIGCMAPQRGIQKKKKDDLLVLCSFLSDWKKTFFDDIPVCEVSTDLEVERED